MKEAKKIVLFNLYKGIKTIKIALFIVRDTKSIDA
jgi:hypothetical protein